MFGKIVRESRFIETLQRETNEAQNVKHGPSDPSLNDLAERRQIVTLADERLDIGIALKQLLRRISDAGPHSLEVEFPYPIQEWIGKFLMALQPENGRWYIIRNASQLEMSPCQGFVVGGHDAHAAID
jgi:hypothetical protein